MVGEVRFNGTAIRLAGIVDWKNTSVDCRSPYASDCVSHGLLGMWRWISRNRSNSRTSVGQDKRRAGGG
jgi:hypothetical protein